MTELDTARLRETMDHLLDVVAKLNTGISDLDSAKAKLHTAEKGLKEIEEKIQSRDTTDEEVATLKGEKQRYEKGKEQAESLFAPVQVDAVRSSGVAAASILEEILRALSAPASSTPSSPPGSTGRSGVSGGRGPQAVSGATGAQSLVSWDLYLNVVIQRFPAVLARFPRLIHLLRPRLIGVVRLLQGRALRTSRGLRPTNAT